MDNTAPAILFLFFTFGKDPFLHQAKYPRVFHGTFPKDGDVIYGRAPKGKTEVQLSPRSIIACNIKGQSGCMGGKIDRAWNFLRKYG